MHLSSILKEYGVDIEKTKLIRHPLSKADVRVVYEKGMIEYYQSCQSKNCYDNCEFVASFVGITGNESKFIGLYKIVDVIEGSDVKRRMPKGYPYPDHFSEPNRYYVMEKQDRMSDMENKLIISWGGSPRAWFQWAKKDKEVLSIASRDDIPFPGYEDVVLSYSELESIVNGDIRYQKWREALSNVNGVYLICDTKRNKQYIGTTYNDIGILGRWTDYVRTHDGGDVGIKSHLDKYPDAFSNFQFTILRVLQKPISSIEATEAESLYKRKLCTRNEEYGLNKN